MITYKTGDVTLASEPVIIHGCNAKGKMNSGVAKAIRAKWPEVFDEYEKMYNQWGLIPGSNVYVKTSDGKLVINAITQDKYGRDPDTVYVDYDAIQLCLEDARTALDTLQHRSIAMPRLGAGLGNGDWSKISQIIEEEMRGIDVVVYVPEGVTI
jgi:O-acetyl-ADP-ribose deacetylase (regulator of RNase III)